MKRANTPLVCGPSSSSGAPRTMRAAGQRATTRRVTVSVPGAPSDDPEVDTPTRFRRSLAASQAAASSSSHSTRTGRRLPCSPLRNGSGNAPTMAGTRMAASQRR